MNRRWRETSLMLNRHPQILEFLEILQLMDSCIRNGNYEDALRLLDYVRMLNVKQGKQVSIIQKIAQKAEDFKEVMVQYLIRELYSDIPVQNIRKVIAFLRRLQLFDEAEIRIKFLIVSLSLSASCNTHTHNGSMLFSSHSTQARDSWLQGLLKELAQEPFLDHLTRFVDIHRAHLFDIVTQYKTIFPSNDLSARSRSTVSSGFLSDKSKVEKDFGDSCILPCWLLMKTNTVLDYCEHKLNGNFKETRANEIKLNLLIEPLFAFASSMARIGCDVRPQMIRIVSKFFNHLFQIRIRSALEKFERSLDNYTIPYKLMATNDSTTVKHTKSNEVEESAPVSLLPFSPLAALHNDLMQSLNGVGSLVIIHCMAFMRETLNQQLCQASNAVARYYRAEVSGLKEQEHLILDQFCSQFAFKLLPRLQDCFNQLCPPAHTAQLLAMSKLEFAKLRKSNEQIAFSQLNVEKALEPLQELLGNRSTMSS